MSILNDIVQHKKQEIAMQKKNMTKEKLLQNISTDTRDFAGQLSMPGLSLIAEVKYTSPSAGILPDQRDPVTRAQAYEQSGAHALSVLTDNRFFGGSLEHLRIIREHTSLPVLRKDFIIDEYQIYQSRMLGADAILLIVRLLPDDDLERFIKIARELNMSPLVEVHNEQDISKAREAHAHCMGINNRDLDTLDVDISTSIRLKPHVPEHCITVSESGITTPEDIERIETAGFNAVLIGHALAHAGCTQDTIQRLQGRSYDSTR